MTGFHSGAIPVKKAGYRNEIASAAGITLIAGMKTSAKRPTGMKRRL
jgi:hypothetical protein